MLPRVTFDDALAWFQANGGDTDRNYLKSHFERLVAVRDFALRAPGAPVRSHLTVLDIGAHWLHLALLFADEGHKLICADVGNTFRYQPVQVSAKAMGADLITYTRLDLGEGVWDSPENSVDMVLFSEILEHITFNPITMWRAIYQALKPGGWIIVSTPNGTQFHRLKRQLEALVDQGQIGTPVHEIMEGGTYGHHWKEYSIREIVTYFTMLSMDLTVTRWTTWGSQNDEVSSALQQLLTDSETPTERAATDPIIGLLRKIARAGHPLLGYTLLAEVTLRAKEAGITIRPPWEVG